MKIMKIFKGKGYREYKHYKTRVKFAESMLNVGNGIFLLIFILIFHAAKSGPGADIRNLPMAVGGAAMVAEFFRHIGLKMLDRIEEDNQPKPSRRKVKCSRIRF